uniref:TNFR-Cys domain-containing protein n=1 Tax=Mola mola TaxID=94237 RepID=A0A3Q3WUX8_MOLML
MSLDPLCILLFISSYFLLSPSSDLLFSRFLLTPVLSSAGETFSENYSVTEECQACTQCTGLMRMETPCTDSNDAICVCDYNYFFDAITGQCEPCTVCPAGQGVFTHCEHNHDTMCEECVDDTYSDRESSLDPCLPCTICDEETEIQLAVCTPISDSVCHSNGGCVDVLFLVFAFPVSDSLIPTAVCSVRSSHQTGTSDWSIGQFEPFLQFQDQLQRSYCSLVAGTLSCILELLYMYQSQSDVPFQMAGSLKL